ncbi:TPA: 1,4-dihydroxy-2-naphthoate octaprenyltransferase [Neisseria weaveri]
MAVRYWLQAARPRTLPLALASTLCGGLLAAQQGKLHIITLVLSILTAALLQIFSNLANDYGDAVHGADNRLRQGPERMVAGGKISRTAMQKALLACAISCCLSGILLLSATRPDIRYTLWLLLGASAVLAAFTYTAGIKPYGYHGFGEAAVLLFFGWLGVIGSEYLHTGRLNMLSFLPATALGLWCCTVLNLNNMRDIDSDTCAGKRTLAVRLGTARAKLYHTALLLIAALCWSIWLPLAYTAGKQAVLQTVLLVFSTAHLFFLKKASSPLLLNRMLPQWSFTVLTWVVLLWLAADIPADYIR